ncbi:hypothetical protein TWF173_010526 [Orbilia oligospora]|uniref:Secreted protein n=1 Tax=Orbilia oligospora TaxID=2813651 RepID=A0A7C8VSG2_ORBOL|nr:hypothetical protein TWF970_000421 [Orbilia oligospora]KAF3309820.1 hypothetical protein TWF173_010526 [Orbilia oligospora]
MPRFLLKLKAWSMFMASLHDVTSLVKAPPSRERTKVQVHATFKYSPFPRDRDFYHQPQNLWDSIANRSKRACTPLHNRGSTHSEFHDQQGSWFGRFQWANQSLSLRKSYHEFMKGPN